MTCMLLLILLGVGLWLALLLGVVGVCASAKRGDRALARDRRVRGATLRVAGRSAWRRTPAA